MYLLSLYSPGQVYKRKWTGLFSDKKPGLGKTDQKINQVGQDKPFTTYLQQQIKIFNCNYNRYKTFVKPSYDISNISQYILKSLIIIK